MAYQWCRVVNDVLHTKRRKGAAKRSVSQRFQGFFQPLKNRLPDPENIKITCENSQVIFSVAALDAYLIEYLKQIVDSGVLLFLARSV